MKIRLTERGKAILKNSISKTGCFIPKLRKPHYREYTLIEFSRAAEPVRRSKIIIDESRYFRS